MSETYIPEVDSVSLYLEIARNLVAPLEIVREAISNSHDAGAANISIIVDPDRNGAHTIEIVDDGEGMDEDGIKRFFDLGRSLKLPDRIGEKGLGTKTYFRSQRIAVETQRNGESKILANMEDPWQKLQNHEMPAMEFDFHEREAGKDGTTVRIIGYCMDEPERFFNFETLEDYIRWFTAAGSFKTKFTDYPYLHEQVKDLSVAPRVFLTAATRDGNKEENEIPGTHWFAHPNETPKVPEGEPDLTPSDLYCKHFGAFEQSTIIQGEQVSVQVYGTVSGAHSRRTACHLRQGITLKSRFGCYLCKDFIPFMKRNQLVASDEAYLHFHILVNSQAFSMTSDRNNLANEDDAAVRWALETAKEIIDDNIKPVAEQTYFAMREREEEEKKLQRQREKLDARRAEFKGLPNLRQPSDQWPVLKHPTCEAQVAILFAAVLGNQETRELLPCKLKIGTYSQDSPTDMICVDDNGEPVLVELEYRLSNLFQHGHALDTFDYVVCWDRDIDAGESRPAAGKTLTLAEQDNQWFLTWGAKIRVPVITLQEILSRYAAEAT